MYTGGGPVNNGTLLRSVVTRNGECFDAEFRQIHAALPPDDALYYFYLVDRVKQRGMRKVSIRTSGPEEWYSVNFDARLDNVLVNTIRRAFDSGLLTFDVPDDPINYKQVFMDRNAFNPSPAASDEEVRQFLIHTAYWESYKPGNRYPVQFDTPANLESLGVTAEEIRRNQWFSAEDGLQERSNLPGMGRPTVSLVKIYEKSQSTVIGTEEVFPKGTQYRPAYLPGIALNRDLNRKLRSNAVVRAHDHHGNPDGVR